jgi:hypothetical protein
VLKRGHSALIVLLMKKMWMLYGSDIDGIFTIEIVILMIIDVFIGVKRLMMPLHGQLMTVAFYLR